LCHVVNIVDNFATARAQLTVLGKYLPEYSLTTDTAIF